MEYYKHQYLPGLEKYFVLMEDWLKQTPARDEDNKPLVLQLNDSVTIKTLLVRWMDSRQKAGQRFDDVIIPHFASAGGNHSNYFYTIYRILVRLREMFNIKQKVELVEEKIRRNFSYWLELVQQQMDKSVIYDGQVIILIEGIHNFKEFGTDQESEIKFWLPKNFPKRIRVIVTVDKDKKSLHNLVRRGSKIIEVDKVTLTTQDFRKRLVRKEFLLGPDYQNWFLDMLNHKIEAHLEPVKAKALMSSFCPHPTLKILERSQVDLEAVEKILDRKTLQKLFTGITNETCIPTLLIEFFEDKICQPSQFREVMLFLTLTFKGLTLTELMNLTKIDQQQWKQLLVFFKPYFFTFKGLWSVSDESFKHSVSKRYLEGKLKNAVPFYARIGKEMDNTPNSIRKLEEQTINYFLAQEFALLKQTISDIENFLILFNPYTKYDLCRYWQALERKGYDPVNEFIKRLESFTLHYEPSAGDLFTIILQISRFFKEFADFETRETPTFRHPYVKGKFVQMQTKKKEDDDGSKDESQQIKSKVDILNFLKSQSKKFPSKLDEPEAKSKTTKTQMAREHSRDTAGHQSLNRSRSQSPSMSKVASMQNVCRVEEHKKPAPQKKLSHQTPAEIFLAYQDSDVELEADERTIFMTDAQKEEKRLKEAHRLAPGVVSYLQDIGLEQEVFDMDMTEDTCPPAVTEAEGSNIEIPHLREKFLTRFKNEINDRNMRRALIDPQVLQDITLPGAEGSSDYQRSSAILNQTQNEDGYVDETFKMMNEIDLHIESMQAPHYYYYKRWIWVMFPWACLQTDQTYSFSKMIHKCYSSNIRYISVREDKKLTDRKLCITQTASAS